MLGNKGIEKEGISSGGHRKKVGREGQKVRKRTKRSALYAPRGKKRDRGKKADGLFLKLQCEKDEIKKKGSRKRKPTCQSSFFVGKGEGSIRGKGGNHPALSTEVDQNFVP